MKNLKPFSFAYSGSFRDAYFINFSIDPQELEQMLPRNLKPLLIGKRALISVIDVHLDDMRIHPGIFPFSFNYQHIGFRILVEDPFKKQTDDGYGVYFLRSFTDRSLIVAGGNILTEFNLQKGCILNFPAGTKLKSGTSVFRYNTDGPLMDPDEKPIGIQKILEKVNIAWSVYNDEIYSRKIERDGFPLIPVNCNRFETNFFKSAQLEGVFKLNRTVRYTWLPPEKPESPSLERKTAILKKEILVPA